MVEPEDDRLSGDMPVPHGPALPEEERPLVSHEVIASYVADAARSVPGIVDLHASHWKKLSSKVRETRSGGVVVKDPWPRRRGGRDTRPGGLGLGDTRAGREVEEAVARGMTALLSIDLDAVTLFVDEIAGQGRRDD